MAETCPGRCVLFSRRQHLPEGAFVENQNLVMQWQGRHHALINVRQIRLKGPHNLENALAATAVGFLSKLPLEAIRQTLQEFRGVEHRLEFVKEVAGVSFYNDSKATNVDSAAVALKSFRKPVIAIMGGRDKGADFERLQPLMVGVRKLFLIGEAADRIRVALGSHAETILCGSLEEAVWQAFHAARPEEAVLLSPACSSFDMFENYEERGKAFKRTVQSLRLEITLQ
jgi:UDP-N-acetylmuramoylalanine--D-glutamate ligase